MAALAVLECLQMYIGHEVLLRMAHLDGFSKFNACAIRCVLSNLGIVSMTATAN